MSISNSSRPDDSQSARDTHKSILKSTSIMSLGTLSSRILGFIRDVILARLLGTGFAADAFFLAFKIPNLFRDFVGEGATNAAVVPVLSEYKHKNERQEFWQFVHVVFAWALIILSVITIVGIIAAPIIVRVIAPGFMDDPDKLDLTVRLTRVMFPYLVFIGLTAYSMGLLFTFRSFLAPAFSPCFLNIALIGAALYVAGQTDPTFGLAIGVLVGGVLQLLFYVAPLKKIGFKFKWPKRLNHEGAKKVGKLLIPRMFGAGVYQLTVLVDTLCASLSAIVGAGGISAIYYANRIIHFPMGIFSVALASAVLPTFSTLAHEESHENLKKTLVFSLENIFFIMCPTIIVTYLLSEPIIRVLFQRGEFDVYSTTVTSGALAFYAFGLFAFGGIKVMVAAFHALQDTKTPVIVAAICLVINAVLNVALMFPLKISGIALASSIAGTVDFCILYAVMHKRLGGMGHGMKSYIIRVISAALITGIGVHLLWQMTPTANEFIKLISVGGLGFVIYGLLAFVLKIDQAQKILAWILKKK